MTHKSLSSLYSVSLNFYHYFILIFTASSLLILGVVICANFDIWFFGGENSSDDSDSSKKKKECSSSKKKKSEVKGKGHRHRPHKQQKQPKNPARIRSGHVKELVAADLKALATTAKEDPTYDPHNEGLLLVDRDIYLSLKEGKTSGSLFTAKTTPTKLSASGHPLLDRHLPSNSSIKSKSKTNSTTKTVTFKVKSKTNDSKKTTATAASKGTGAIVLKKGKHNSLL